MQLKQQNTKKQGDVGMGVAIGYFASQGMTVCVPLTDSQDYDLVVDFDGVIKRIQVKTTTSLARNGKGYKVELRVRGGNKSGTGKNKLFDPQKVDFVFVLTERWDQYLIPSKEIKGTGQLLVGNQSYKQFLVSSREPFEIPGELFAK